MKNILFCLSLLFAAAAFAQNPMLVRGTPTPFDRITVHDIRQATSTLLPQAATEFGRLAKLNPADANKQTLLVPFDAAYDRLKEFEGTLSLLSATHPDERIRSTCDSVLQQLDKFYNNEILLNADLYKVFKGARLVKATPQEQRFLDRTVSDFERKGIALPPDRRQQLISLQARILTWSQQFERNIAEHRDSLVVTEADLAGVSDGVKNGARRSNGSYVLRINSPTYQDVLTNGRHESLRKAMWIKYNNRAYPENIAVLDSLFRDRHALASLLGFRSYAAYAVANKMAKDPSAVWQFERDLAAKLYKPVQKELEEAAQFKRSLGDNTALQPWDISYVRNQLLQKKYALNTNEVKAYFPLRSVVDGVFAVYQRLYGIEIKPSGKYPVWSDKVTAYEIFKDGKLAGAFYLDMYPRAGKYTHFACSPMRVRHSEKGNTMLPMATLICNFPEPSETSPSLLTMAQVETLFHEFGHLIHVMFMDTPFAMQSWNYTGDFIEAPSQIMENWAWNYDVLRLFARHYQNNQVIPRALFDKLNQSRYEGAASAGLQQVFLGTLDFTYHDKYDSIRNTPLNDVSHQLRRKLGLPSSADEHFIAAFGHLSGYGANYYGYLWSAVYAEDMFSVFEKEGILNPTTGNRYRQKILSPGVSRDDFESVKDFLGRAPDSRAFLRSLGLTL